MSALAVEFSSGGEPGEEPDPSPRARLARAGDERTGDADADELRVLLVEDDRSMQLLLRVNLELSGFKVVSAMTGADAVALAEADAFDLVLLDVMLPDLGGFEVADRLRPGATPIVFVSARGSELDIERGRAAGGVDYIVKPFDPLELGPRLRENLEELGRSGPAGVWRMRHGRR